ncbi:MAG: TSCPD domain-containing protein, partial [Candidatus Magnetoovum sp. WYHC-5]|nr:TSCPD domain-containing protein [Candidatus Magnetoovum sp. WYHC-5]
DDTDVDWERLRKTIWKAVHFLDNVIDVNKYPITKIEETTRLYRKIGLGIMGWADMLIQLGIPYNSEQALALAEKLMAYINTESHNASERLAEQRGSFPKHSESIYSSVRKMRNATVTTIAPTGSLSIIAGCSSGIEPIFAVSYIRNIMDSTKLIEVNPYFEQMAKAQGFYSETLMERIAERSSLAGFGELPVAIRQIFVTAHDVEPNAHIKMQSAFQKYVDNAVSKTVNFPKEASTEDVKKVFMLAYTTNCKGVTVYRDGSRQEQVLSVNKCDTKKTTTTTYQKIVPRQRPSVMKGTTQCMLTGCGNLYITINEDERGMPFEVFNQMGKAGGCAASQSEAIGRLVSLALRCNIAYEELIGQLKGISCHQPIWANGGKISSCADAIAKAMEGYCRKHSGVPVKVHNTSLIMGACPECGGAVEYEGGCAVCHDCGYTKCS